MYCDCLKEIAEAIIVKLKKKKSSRCVFNMVLTNKSRMRDNHTLKPTGISHFLTLQSEYESHFDHQELPPLRFSTVAGQLYHTQGDFCSEKPYRGFTVKVFCTLYNVKKQPVVCSL